MYFVPPVYLVLYYPHGFISHAGYFHLIFRMTSRHITVLIPNQAKGSLLHEKHHRASQPRPLASWPFLWDLPDLNLYPYRVRLGQVIPVAFSSVLVGLPGASPLPVTWVSYPFQLFSVPLWPPLCLWIALGAIQTPEAIGQRGIPALWRSLLPTRSFKKAVVVLIGFVLIGCTRAVWTRL